MRESFHIDAPVETVFDFFVDPDRSADLYPNVQILEYKRTQEGAGTYISYHAKLAGIPFDSFSVLTDWVPNKHLTEKSSSAIVGTWDYTFEPEGKGTKVTMEHHSRSVWNLPGVRNLGDLVTARMNESFMRKVKGRIEAPAA